MGLGLSVVILVRDEDQMLPGCLARLSFADEVVVVVDDRSTDRSEVIARDAGAVVLIHPFRSFADAKNAGLDRTSGEWVLFIDADERVSVALAAEIREALGRPADAYRIPIVNYFYGSRMQHGGWASERPVRLVRRGAARYTGEIHEVLELLPETKTAELANPIAHFSHRSVVDNLRKTAEYAEIQARDLVARGAPPVTGWTLARVVARELTRRLVRRGGWRDGVPGWIEALYQPLSLMSVHARLWEIQQREPSIPEKYADLEEQTR